MLGPSNQDLADGAQELLAGNYEEGVMLTERGLTYARGRKEKQVGFSNLCAGYLLLNQWEKALGFCDQALEINPRHWRALSNRAMVYVQLERYEEAKADLDLGQEIAPNATSLKEVRGRLLDATNPVTPNIQIDDRRSDNPKNDS